MRRLLSTLLVLAAAGACGGSSGDGGPAGGAPPGATATPGAPAPTPPAAPLPTPTAPATPTAPSSATPAAPVAPCYGGYQVGDAVRALAASTSGVWAVGLPGTVLRFDGAAWTPSCLAEPVSLAAVWAAGANDAWAAGGQAVYRWNGSGWARVQLGAPVNGTFGSIWGSSPTDVWIVAEDVALHWDGGAFAAHTLADMRALGFPFGAFREVWGTAANDVWIAADRGTLHWDGQSWWGSLAAPEDELLSSVWADDPADAFTVGVSLEGGGAAWRWAGNGWRPESWDVDIPQLEAVRGAPTGEVFYQTPTDLLLRADGVTRRLAPPAAPSGAPLVVAANDVWLPDVRGVSRWNGVGWTRSLDVPR